MRRTDDRTDDPPELAEHLTAAETADLLAAHRTTIARWAREGHIRYIHTPDGYRRYLRADIEAIINGRPTPAADPAETEERATA
ncbi:helix-turn-helix domain-containing protein [Streptomonospora salina]|uniref:Excisionase family DNA binding protein n=1 Tax=Streptomonospora salina TaxID=104205 RepID=A0A841ECK5_9ACTN|nr:helix-turn-helix domain-containing protein [Streptomonospora salina]MBB5998793.1 excisionase family DNA binding protein [Streptomonospora salina]